MKHMRRCERMIAAIVLFLFVFTGVWFAVTVKREASRWTASSYNLRISSAKKSANMGALFDRNGNLLATNDESGNRVYQPNEAVRRALSQTLGDPQSMSGLGIETFHASTLLGVSGSVLDRLNQMLKGQERTGRSMWLTLDAGLSTYISQNFPSGYSGAAVVMNYKTGEILAMVSKPDYDPQIVADGGTEVNLADSAYLNRCLQGMYAPGSVFKIITLASTLENLPSAPQAVYTCDGVWQYEGGQVVCAKNTAHDTMTLAQAFAKSCNVTFARLSYELGSENLVRTAKKFGLNADFRFSDLVLYNSQIEENITSVGELAWTGVGQGKTLVTPLHMCMIASAIANRGVMPSPKLIANVTGSGGTVVARSVDPDYGRVVSEEVAYTIAQYMRGSVTGGTSSNANIAGHLVCGKTGSAQVSDDPNVETNAWFTGFVYEDDSPYAVAVVVEAGGAGSNLAAKLAKQALTYAIENIR